MDAANLTELEVKVINTIKTNGDEYDGMQYLCAEDISGNIGETTNVVRGVLASLVKKELVVIDKVVSGCPAFVMLISK